MQLHPKQSAQLLSVVFLCVFAAIMVGLLLLFDPSTNSQGGAGKLRFMNTLRLGLLEQRTKQAVSQRSPSIQVTDLLAARYGWDMQYVRYPSFAEMVNALEAGEIEVIADMVIDSHPDHNLRYSSSYDKGKPVLVYFPKVTKKPQDAVSLTNLPKNSLLVINNSWQERYLDRQQVIYPDLLWQEVPDFFSLQELIESIAGAPGGFSLVLEREYAALSFSNPNLTTLTHLEAIDLGFGFRETDIELELLFSRTIKDWLQQRESESGYENVALPRIGRLELQYFLKRMETRLPKYIDFMVEAGQMFNVDWRLIAAIAYQESHWDKDAVSPTGVRGLMMLTEATAASVGVEDRTDPYQSILGGTRYFVFLRDQIPERIVEPDRSWFALAAYNVGFAHVEDVRIHTQRTGGNPDVWEGVSANLHLLEDPGWYKKNSTYGFARGREARGYVSNIRKYFEVLLYLQNLEQPKSPAADGEAVQVEVAQPAPRLVLPKRILARY